MIEEKLVIITNGNYFASLILDEVLTRWSKSIKGILIITGDYKGRTGINAFWKLGKVTAWPYFGYKIISYAFFKVSQKLCPNRKFSVKKYAQRLNIPYKEMQSVKSVEAINWVQSLSPDLIVSVSCPQMIGKKILDSARFGGINIHSSLLPAYAGLAPYHWVLSKGEKETGISIHFMKLKFDEGNILVQRSLKISAGESAFHLFTRLAKIGNEILPVAICKVLDGEVGYQQDMNKRSYFSNPTLESYKSLHGNGHCLMRVRDFLEVFRTEKQVSSSSG